MNDFILNDKSITIEVSSTYYDIRTHERRLNEIVSDLLKNFFFFHFSLDIEFVISVRKFKTAKRQAPLGNVRRNVVGRRRPWCYLPIGRYGDLARSDRRQMTWRVWTARLSDRRRPRSVHDMADDGCQGWRRRQPSLPLAVSSRPGGEPPRGQPRRQKRHTRRRRRGAGRGAYRQNGDGLGDGDTLTVHIPTCLLDKSRPYSRKKKPDLRLIFIRLRNVKSLIG